MAQTSCTHVRWLAGLAQPLLGVFGQEIAERDAAAPGLGREPPALVAIATPFGPAPTTATVDTPRG